MKKGLNLLFALMVVLIFAVTANIFIDSPSVSAIAPTNTPTSIPPTATATTVPTTAPRDESPANKTWIVSGEESSVEVPMYMVPLPAPHAWEILLSNAIQLELSAPVQLCHPFRGNQFGWTGAIYLRSGSGWIEIPSTTEWTPDEEGNILICATAPMSGTYTIFGYAEAYEPVVYEDDEPPRNDQPTGYVFPLTGHTME